MMKIVVLVAFALSALLAGAAEPVRTAVLCGGPTFGRLCQLSGKTKPHVLVFNTAAKDDPQRISYLVNGFIGAGAEAEAVKLWNVQIGDAAPLREKILAADVIWFHGGMTEWLCEKIGFYHLADTFREAYRRGTVLGGWSAGSIVLTHAGYNDFSDKRYDLCAGMGLLDVYFCPHYQIAIWKGFDRRIESETAPGTPSVGWAVEDGSLVVFRNERATVEIGNRDSHVWYFTRTNGKWTKESLPNGATR